MLDRVRLIMKAKNLNASQFADEVSVQRSGISHILSGRNNPSLDLIQKILKRYPELNPDWLLFGSGPMMKELDLFSEMEEKFGSRSSKTKGSQIKTSDKEETDKEMVFERPAQTLQKEVEKEVRMTGTSADDAARDVPLQRSGPAQARQQLSETKETPVEKTTGISSAAKKAEKILVFFDDRTYREYFPE